MLLRNPETNLDNRDADDGRVLRRAKAKHDAALDRITLLDPGEKRQYAGGRPWTTKEERYLKRQVRQGTPRELVAKVLGRTVHAVNEHLAVMRRRGAR